MLEKLKNEPVVTIGAILAVVIGAWSEISTGLPEGAGWKAVAVAAAVWAMRFFVTPERAVRGRLVEAQAQGRLGLKTNPDDLKRAHNEGASIANTEALKTYRTWDDRKGGDPDAK